MQKLEAAVDVVLPKGVSSKIDVAVPNDLSAELDVKLVGNATGGGASNTILLNGYKLNPDIYGNININAATQINLTSANTTTTELKVDKNGVISLGDIIIDCGGALDG